MSAETVTIGWNEIDSRATKIAEKISKEIPSRNLNIYGVPNGGVIPATLVVEKLKLLHGRGNLLRTMTRLVEQPIHADVVIDDIVDSGNTRRNFSSIPFYALVDKLGDDADLKGKWVEFPWERMASSKGDTVQDNIRRLLQFIGEDPQRPGLRETPDRVVRSYTEIFGGYKMDVGELFKVFDEQASDEIVLSRDTEFYSVCEHHMQPFFGKAHIAYIPQGGRVIGISKLARILDVFSCRLQIQERIGSQVVDSLMDPKNGLNPLGAACIIEAAHFCIRCRGVNKQNSEMVTSCMKGVFREKPEARGELMFLISLGKK